MALLWRLPASDCFIIEVDLLDILVVGSGGREHSICWALRKSQRVNKLYCAPGNGGIAGIAECVDIGVKDIAGIVDFAKDNADYVVVAPDDPLATGMVDALESAGIRAFGPRKAAAMIESSKVYAKSVMKKYGIPTAEYAVFTGAAEASEYIRKAGAPIVIKADGLALGKGVVVAHDIMTAIEAVESIMLDKKFGDSGNRVIIEEYMTGPEITLLAFTDGKTVIPMLSSQDHKRALTGNLGPNTGGMGAFCPSPLYTEAIADVCMKTIVRPTIEALAQEGRPFKGVLYFGLMLTPGGMRVVEYNARFGDPEAQPILTMLKTDLLDIFEAVTDERLDEIDIEWNEGYACCVVMASGGYPDSYQTGYEITGLAKVPDDIIVFHAGSKRSGDAILTNGGRVLGVTAAGDTLESAVNRVYEGVGNIRFENAYFRTDIGRL